MVNPHNYKVLAVGCHVEALREDLADLCQCPPVGQEHFATYTTYSETAHRIALLWNMTRHVPTESLQEHLAK